MDVQKQEIFKFSKQFDKQGESSQTINSSAPLQTGFACQQSMARIQNPDENHFLNQQNVVRLSTLASQL